MTDDHDDPDVGDPSPHTRASGATPAVEDARTAAQDMDAPMSEVNVGNDIDREHRSPRFLMMRFNWENMEEVAVVRQAQHAASSRVLREFVDAYQILTEIQDIVRTPEEDENGNRRYDEHGEVVWRRTHSGRIEEDFTKLTRGQIQSFIGLITTRLFAWEQAAEALWLEAMMARSQFEERYAISYDQLRGTASRTTVDDRKAFANAEASTERYFAIYMTSVSRRAQAIVRSMERLSQRLKDVLTA